MSAGHSKPMKWKVPLAISGARAKMSLSATLPNKVEDEENAEHETEVADAVDDEGLDRRRIGGRPVVPEADQQIGSQTNAFPAEEHLGKVI